MGSKAETKNKPPAIDNNSSLYHFIEQEVQTLLPTIRRYVNYAAIAKDWNEVEYIAADILQESVIEALKHSQRFDEKRVPKMWFLGIAANLVKREKARVIKEKHRIASIPNEFFEEDNQTFDLITKLASKFDTESTYLADEQVKIMLSLVSSADVEILRLALLVGLDGEELAARLGLKPVTARSRLHRALTRLRTEWYRYQREGGNLND